MDEAHQREQAPGSVSPQDRADLKICNDKINALLPPQYQNCYDAIKPVSMGSAEILYGPDGKVAWDQIWTSFCDLALAGGPPHRGKLLVPATVEEVFAEREAYQKVVEEIARGIWMVTELPVLPHVAPGWIGVRCRDEMMASWLVRAVMAENVFARQERNFLYLPAGPRFRLAKEIKNVVTVSAKTNHYWTFHMLPSKWSVPAAASELLEAALPEEALSAPEEYQKVVQEIERGIFQATQLACVPSENLGWVAVPCCDVEMAVWLMRAVMVENVVVRREETLLFMPAHPKFAAREKARQVVTTFAHALQLWKAHLALNLNAAP